jgi:hypothetical protein
MEVTSIAQAVAGFGALALVVAVINVLALRVVEVEDVPACVQGRIRWWGAHNAAFLVGSTAVTAVGTITLIAAALA